MRDDGIYLVPRLSSHGVAILAIYCSNDFLTGDSFNSRHAYSRPAQAVNSSQPQIRKNDTRAEERGAKVRN